MIRSNYLKVTMPNVSPSTLQGMDKKTDRFCFLEEHCVDSVEVGVQGTVPGEAGAPEASWTNDASVMKVPLIPVA